MSDTRILEHFKAFVGRLEDEWPDMTIKDVRTLDELLELKLWPLVCKRSGNERRNG